MAASEMKALVRRCEQARGVFTTVRREEAVVEARHAAARLRQGVSLGPLDGVPLGVKDSFDVECLITTNCSLVDAAAAPAPQDAELVRRLRRRGMVVIGKTNMSELAFSGLGLNPHFGTPPNPRSAAVPLVPGGSSSGSAVAVADGLVPLALGTDTSGSARVPAAFCGVVGYKASEDFFPKDGIRALAPALDSVGVLGNRVDTIRLLVEAATGRAQPSHPAPRFLVPRDAVVEHSEPAVAHWFEEQVRLLSESGHSIEHQRMPALEEAQRLIDDHGSIVAMQAFQRHGHYLEEQSSVGLDPNIARRLRNAASTDATPVLRAQERLRRAATDQLGDRLLLCPTVSLMPPPMRTVTSSEKNFDKLNAQVLRTTMLLSYLGMPGVSLPLANGGKQGLGLLVSGRQDTDAAVLAAAEVVDRVGDD